MNGFIWKKHQDTTLEEANRMLEKSHWQVMELAETFTDEELFTKGIYKWSAEAPAGSVKILEKPVIFCCYGHIVVRGQRYVFY